MFHNKTNHSLVVCVVSNLRCNKGSRQEDEDCNWQVVDRINRHGFTLIHTRLHNLIQVISYRRVINLFNNNSNRPTSHFLIVYLEGQSRDK